MKKFMSILSTVFAVLMIVVVYSCAGCSKEPVKNESISVAPLVVENTISTDRQDMYISIGGKEYRWFETTIYLKEFLDAENASSDIESVTNTFQYLIEHSTGTDVRVQCYIHTTDSTSKPEPINAFMLENYPLDEEPIDIKFTEAFNKLMEANIPKPHSKYCVLRKPVGPKTCNAQYIFGNSKMQVYVDAVTGEVKNSNPAFGDGFGMPLGEWP